MAHYAVPGSRIRIARRICQLAVLSMLFLIPALGRYQALRNQADRVGIGRELGPRLLHAVLAEVEDPEPFTTSLRGSVWTMRIGSAVVSDPLAGADFVAATGEGWDPFLLTILVPVLATMLLGRVFCGWICPADLLFELGHLAARHERRVPQSRFRTCPPTPTAGRP